MRRHCARGRRWELVCELHLLVVVVVIVIVIVVIVIVVVVVIIIVVLRQVHIWDSLVDILPVVQVG